MAGAGWTWRYEDGAGDEVTGTTQAGAVGATLPREGFGTQGDAESWLGEAWRDLLAAGVHRVSLLEDERVVYGPMSLLPGPDRD